MGTRGFTRADFVHPQMMSGEREAKLLEYICERIGDTGCGGLADRSVGFVRGRQKTAC